MIHLQPDLSFLSFFSLFFFSHWNAEELGEAYDMLRVLVVYYEY